MLKFYEIKKTKKNRYYKVVRQVMELDKNNLNILYLFDVTYNLILILLLNIIFTRHCNIVWILTKCL